MERSAPVFVAGHRGLLGRALVRRLRARGNPLVLASHDTLELTDPEAVRAFFRRERPAYVFLAAARVGGIVANQREPVPFLRTNLEIELAVLGAAHETDVQGLVLFGSSCMYPREAPQPIREGSLHGGPLETTSRPYAVSKLAGVELCRAYRAQHGRRFFSLVPATLYGAYDHFGSPRAHVIPALMERFHRAREQGDAFATVLGSGRAYREFLHCDDAADASLHAMDSEAELDVVNAGSGEEVSIADLAQRIAKVVDYPGEIRFDPSAPDGAPRKCLDSGALRALGWTPRIALDEGLERTYAWYRKTVAVSAPGATATDEEEREFRTYS